MVGGLLAVAALLGGCSADRGSSTVTVLAAASLTSAFTAEAHAFESRHPGTHVVLSFAGSQSLVAQVQQGAPADALATADTATMGRLHPPGVRVFAHNQLAIITAPGNPLRVHDLRDLARPGLRVVLAGPTVPVGKAAARALARAGVVVHPVSLEDAVTGVVGKVRLGEADAGIGYVTDATQGVAGTPLPGTTTDLAIASLSSRGRGFVAFVLSGPGQAILREHGFR